MEKTDFTLKTDEFIRNIEQKIGMRMDDFSRSSVVELLSEFANAMTEELKRELEDAKKHMVIWHDLRENSKDLPDTSRNVLVVRDFGEDVPLEAEFDNYFNDDEFIGWGLNYGDHAYFTKVMAWCEVPQFNKS